MIIKLNGDRFSNLEEFYNEVENQLTRNINFKFGRNLDAFNDILRGGFGVFEFEEPIELIWLNSDKSKADLGFSETIRLLESMIQNCHPANRRSIEKELELAKRLEGENLFDKIVQIIKTHKHIKLTLD